MKDTHRMNRLIAAAAAALTCGLLISTQPALAQAVAAPEPTVEQRIAFYQKKLEQHPRLFVVHTQLAAAYLDKAREALDPQWLKRAEQSLDQSLKIYANFDAYKGLLVLNAYRHHFAEARRWGEIARKLNVDDNEVLAVLVEADLGLGDVERAIKRLPALNAEPQFFHVAVASANVFKAKQQYREARNAFLKAEQLARAENLDTLAAWARTNAAGMLIDSGQAPAARADLDAATNIKKGDPILRLHWAEYHEGIHEPAKALAIVESLLEEAPHPSFHYRAYRLAKALGYPLKAQAHYQAAETGYLQAVQADEIYTLGSLAQLYCEADVHLDQALELAQRNLKFKRDDEALESLKCVKDKLAAKEKKNTRSAQRI